MTESRENLRRRQFRERSTLTADTPPGAIRLDLLCGVQGCLNLKTGPNLCTPHQQSPDNPPTLHQCRQCGPLPGGTAKTSPDTSWSDPDG